MLIITSILITKMSWNVEKLFVILSVFKLTPIFQNKNWGMYCKLQLRLPFSVEYTPLLLAAVLFSLEATLGVS